MDIFEIRDYPWSKLVTDFWICNSCKVVDRNRKRIEVDYKCPCCGALSGRGTYYFMPRSSVIGVLSLIDLMQEFFHLEQEEDVDSGAPTDWVMERDHQVGVVIFFCALVEVLLQHFLEQIMSKKKLPHKVQKRLLDDNLSVKQRCEKLFYAMTNETWNTAVKRLSERVDLDYVAINKFCKLASEARNKFLHEGNIWAVPQDMPKQCVSHIWPLLCLFVALHNEYVPRRIRRSRTLESKEGTARS